MPRYRVCCLSTPKHPHILKRNPLSTSVGPFKPMVRTLSTTVQPPEHESSILEHDGATHGYNGLAFDLNPGTVWHPRHYLSPQAQSDTSGTIPEPPGTI